MLAKARVQITEAVLLLLGALLISMLILSQFGVRLGALLSAPLAFAVMVILSLADRGKSASEARAAFSEQYVTAHTGRRPSSLSEAGAGRASIFAPVRRRNSVTE